MSTTLEIKTGAFSQAEDDCIRNSYRKLGCFAVARRLGRDPLSVRQRARRLQVGGAIRGPTWTKLELIVLRELWPDAKAIARQLGRSLNGVNDRARKLGLVGIAASYPPLDHLGPRAACPNCGGTAWSFEKCLGCGGRRNNMTTTCPTPAQIEQAAALIRQIIPRDPMYRVV